MGIGSRGMEIDIRAEAQSRSIQSLDLSMLTEQDLLNLILQRSEIMFDVPRSGRLIRAWNAGDEGPLREVISHMGLQFAYRAAAVIQAEYRTIAPRLLQRLPKRIADIGCGYALFDLFAARDTEADFILIDLEQNTRRHFGFADEGAAYSNLRTARLLLEANGVDLGRITTINPSQQSIAAVGVVDMAVSFLACGFHFPVSSYDTFFEDQVRPGGTIMLDLRLSSLGSQIEYLTSLGALSDLPTQAKAQRVVVTKAPHRVLTRRNRMPAPQGMPGMQPTLYQ